MSFLTALGFLTILPTGRSGPSVKELGDSLPFFPLAGLVIGLVLAGLDVVFRNIWPPAVVNALLLTSLLIITGAMHVEGFMDACDGLIGGTNRERRLEIMKDKHVGPFAVAGAVVLLLLKWSALLSLPLPVRFPILAVFPVLSRWCMTLVVGSFPYARPHGLGSAFRQEDTRAKLLLGGAIALLASLVFAATGGVMLFVGVSLLALLIGLWLTRLLGGLTGDTYGAVNEVIETAVLMSAVPLTYTGLIGFLPGLLQR